MRKTTVMILVVFVGLFLGFVGYGNTFGSIPVTVSPTISNMDISGMAVEKTVDGVSINALPVCVREDAETFFDNRTIARDGLLPVFLFVYPTNRRVVDVRLRTPDNRTLQRLSFREASRGWGEMLREDLWKRELGERKIKEKIITRGFVYFRIERWTPALDGFSVLLSFSDGKEETLPLRGRITAR